MADSWRYYPAFLDLAGRLAVVIGEGRDAERKVVRLARYGADVTFICPRPSGDMVERGSSGEFYLEQRGYVRGDLKGAFVALCSTDDVELRRAVYAEAESLGLLLNVAGSPENCTFLLPSVVHREPLQIAVSTSGVAPGLAKRVRKRLQGEFGQEWSRYVELLGEVRSLLIQRIDEPEKRDAVLEGVMNSDLLARLREGEQVTAEAVYDTYIELAAAVEPTAEELLHDESDDIQPEENP